MPLGYLQGGVRMGGENTRAARRPTKLPPTDLGDVIPYELGDASPSELRPPPSLVSGTSVVVRVTPDAERGWVGERKKSERERREREARERERQEVTSPSPSTISKYSGLYSWGVIKSPPPLRAAGAGGARACGFVV